MHVRRGPLIEIVAVHGNVEGADGKPDGPRWIPARPRRRARHAALLMPTRATSRPLLVALGDFVGDAGEHARSAGHKQDDGFRHKKNQRMAGSRCGENSIAGQLGRRPCSAPLGAMLHDPVGEGLLEADVAAGLRIPATCGRISRSARNRYSEDFFRRSSDVVRLASQGHNLTFFGCSNVAAHGTLTT